MAVGMFAGIAVSNFGVALEWYQKLLGAEPTFFPTMSRPSGNWPRTATCASFKTPTEPAARSA